MYVRVWVDDISHRATYIGQYSQDSGIHIMYIRRHCDSLYNKILQHAYFQNINIHIYYTHVYLYLTSQHIHTHRDIVKSAT